MENIKQLQKLAEVFDTDKIITSDEIEQVLKGILVIMNSFKKDNQTLNKETKEVVEILLDRVLTENAKLKETVNRETSDQKEDFAKQVKELKDLVSKVQTIKPIDGVDGKDADEEKIVEDVLAKIKLPEYEVYTLEEKGEDIVAEINALPLEDEYKIDASHIKNLPESKGGTFNGGGWRNLYQLHDVELSSPTDNQVLTYDSTSNTWKNENSAGGGGAWGSITGTLSNQTDLQSALDAKQATLVSGTNIKTINGTSLLGSGDISISGVGTGTANTIAYWDTTTSIASLLTATYPSLTELSYVKGVTSAIQTQLNGKAPSLGADDNYVTDAQLIVIGNTSGTNTGDQDLSSYLTSATAASTYQPLDTQLTSLAGLSYTGNSLKVVRVNAGETAFELATVSGGSPGGSDTQIQFNDGGSFGGDAGLTYNKTTNVLTVTGGEITAPGAGSNSEKFGASATSAGADSVAFGKSASAASQYNLAIGASASATDTNSVAIGALSTASSGGFAFGRGASATATNAMTFGVNSSNSGVNSITIGNSNSVSTNNTILLGVGAVGVGTSIAIGTGAETTAANQLVVGTSGGSGMFISNVFFGNGVTAATPQAYTINGSGGSGTNVAGGNITIAGGKGTGNANGGSIIFSTSDAGGSGTTLQSLTAKMTIVSDGEVRLNSYGVGTFSGTPAYALGVLATGEIVEFTPSGGVSDGDKGDITVSSSGTVWTIDNGVVSLAKQADVATGTVFYRKTAGTGSPEVQTLATLKTDLGLSGTNTGDVTVLDSSEIDFTLAGQQITASLIAGSIANSKLANSAITIAGTSTSLGGSISQDTITGLSSTGIIKRTGANTLAIATSGTDYAPATSGTSILKGNGSGGFSNASAGTDYVAPGAVTSSGLTMATARILGRSTASTGAIEEITVGSGLSLSGGTLSASGGSSGYSLVSYSTGTSSSITVSGLDLSTDLNYKILFQWNTTASGTNGGGVHMRVSGSSANEYNWVNQKVTWTTSATSSQEGKTAENNWIMVGTDGGANYKCCFGEVMLRLFSIDGTNTRVSGKWENMGIEQPDGTDESSHYTGGGYNTGQSNVTSVTFTRLNTSGSPTDAWKVWVFKANTA